MTSYHWLQPTPYLEQQRFSHSSSTPFQPYLNPHPFYTAIRVLTHFNYSTTQLLTYKTHIQLRHLPHPPSQTKSKSTTGPRKFQNPLRTSFYYAPAPHLTQPPIPGPLVINHIGDIHNQSPFNALHSKPVTEHRNVQLPDHPENPPPPPPRRHRLPPHRASPRTGKPSRIGKCPRVRQPTTPLPSYIPVFYLSFSLFNPYTYIHAHQYLSLSSLTLESSETSALLKTPDRTYSLRQKNTSNSVILLSPTASDQGMAAISTIRETVELDLAPQTPVASGGPLKNTGSRGKWHEMFGKGR